MKDNIIFTYRTNCKQFSYYEDYELGKEVRIRTFPSTKTMLEFSYFESLIFFGS